MEVKRGRFPARFKLEIAVCGNFLILLVKYRQIATLFRKKGYLFLSYFVLKNRYVIMITSLNLLDLISYK